MKQELRWLVILVFGFLMSMSVPFVGGGENISSTAQMQSSGVEADFFDEELAHAAPAEGHDGQSARVRSY